MNERPKTLLGIISQFAQQSNQIEEDRLVEASKTTSMIIANMVKLETSVEATQELQKTFGSTFYNKYNSKDNLYCEDQHPESVTEFADDSTIYLDIAKDQPELNEVIIGGVVFKKMDGNIDYTIPENRYKKISIGMNAFLNINVWKVIDGVLKIAVPYLISLTNYETGICNIIAGGLPYEVNVSEPITDKLKIKSVWLMKKNGYPTDIIVRGNRINTTISHATQGLCMVLGNDTEDILDESVMVYVLRDNINIGITTPETIGGEKCSYVRYLVPWENEPIKKMIPRTESHNIIVVPDNGIFEFTVSTDVHIVNPK